MSARGIQVVRVLIYQNLCLVMVPENAAPRMQLGAGRSEYTTGVVVSTTTSRGQAAIRYEDRRQPDSAQENQ